MSQRSWWSPECEGTVQTYRQNDYHRVLTFASLDGHALGGLRTLLYKLLALVVDIYLSEQLSVVCGQG